MDLPVILSMPSRFGRQSLPLPASADIEFDEVPAATVAAIRFSGTCDETKFRSFATRLLDELAGNPSFEATSSPRLAQYDPPFTLPYLRRNEVLVDVKQRAKSGHDRPARDERHA